MTSSRYPQITDELLSAYIDDMVTEDEKALVEAALLAEPEVAWRLETLRYTVNLLHALPAVALPRSFTLSDLQVANGVTQPVVSVAAPVVNRVRQPSRARSSVGGLGEWWQNFWQFGNLFLRNAAAASLAIFFVLSISNFVIASRTSPALRAAPAQNASELMPTAIAEAPKPTTIATATSPVASAQTQNQALVQQTFSVQSEEGTAAAENRNPPSTAIAKVLTNDSAVSAQPESPVAQTGAGVIRSAARAPGPAGGVAGANELAPEQTNAENPQVAASNVAAPSVAAAKGQATHAYSDATTSQVQASAAATETQALTQLTATMTPTAALSAPQTPTIENTPTVSAVSHADNNSTSTAPTAKLTQLAPSREQQPLTEGGRRSLLQIAQLISALVALVFAVLWWRSRATTRQILE